MDLGYCLVSPASSRYQAFLFHETVQLRGLESPQKKTPALLGYVLLFGRLLLWHPTRIQGCRYNNNPGMNSLVVKPQDPSSVLHPDSIKGFSYRFITLYRSTDYLLDIFCDAAISWGFTVTVLGISTSWLKCTWKSLHCPSPIHN